MADTKDVAQEELNLDKKVTIKNIAGWSVGFARIVDGTGDVTITADGSTRLTRNEIISQVQNGNKLFAGLDGNGSHATLYIDDEPTRVEVGFDGDGNKQMVFSEDEVKRVFALKTQSAFENGFTSSFKTRAEKYAVIQAIKKLGLNDYSKIRFAEKYTGYRVQ